MSRLDLWRQRTEWPLIGVAVVFLVAYGLPIALPDLPRWVDVLSGTLMTSAWLVFAVDYVVRLSLADDRWLFARRHWFDLLVVALPVLRPLRLLLLVKVLQRFSRTGVERLRGRVVTYATGSTALLILTSALAITDTERGEPGATVESLGDASGGPSPR